MSFATSLRIAAVQVNASNNLNLNIVRVTELIRSAWKDGAQFISTPENVCMMTWGRENSITNALPFDGHPVIVSMQLLAQELGVWLLLGSVAIRLPNGNLVNRSVLLNHVGNVVACYDKIHMFDVTLSSGETYCESDSFQAGDRAVVASTPFGNLGLSICYDLRFSGLYRMLAKAGARIITVPAAFTKTTGMAHWHTLLRARAIETGAFIVAPAQTGNHEGDRETYGHSLIVDPWGEVLADAGENIGYVVADLDLHRTDEVRSWVPSLKHDRAFTLETV